MKLKFWSGDSDGCPKVFEDKNKLSFSCVKAIVVQPGETQNVPTGIIFGVPKKYILSVSTEPYLSERFAAIFPASIVLDWTDDKELILPVRNNGRNPLHLHPGIPIARGYVSKVESIETSEVEVSLLVDKGSKKAPAKKSDKFKFEVK